VKLKIQTALFHIPLFLIPCNAKLGKVKSPTLRFRNSPKKIPAAAKVWEKFEKNPPAFAALPKQKLNAIRDWSKGERKKWKHILVLGIGGSTLGGQALIQALAHSSKPKVYFLDNLDPLHTNLLFKKLHWKKTLVLVITKSGDTLETIAQFFVVKQKLGKGWRKHIVAITDSKKGFLRELAEKEKLTSFSVPNDVGGRFSVLSEVGLIPAALAGVKVKDLLQGAAAVNPREAFEFAKLHAAAYRKGKNITVFCPYSYRLRSLGEWYAQLLAESVGKSAKVGITPEVSIGAADQHSKLQLWSDGPNDKFFIFLKVEDFGVNHLLPEVSKEFSHLVGKAFLEILHAEFEATTQALSEKQRSLAIWNLPNLKAETLGYLLQFFMLEVAFLGEILGVNPYNQPGVERGKVLARKRLSGN